MVHTTQHGTHIFNNRFMHRLIAMNVYGQWYSVQIDFIFAETRV